MPSVLQNSIGAMCLPPELCEVAYMCVDLYRKNACSRCSKDTNRVCDCGVDAMPMLNSDDSSGSSLNCRTSTLPGKNDFSHPCVSSDGTL